METWKGKLTLLAGQTADVATVLTAGSTTTTVNVSGEITPLVTTTSPTLATVVETERIQQLPIDGRSITTLLYMTTPGVLSDPNGFMPRVYGLRNASELMEDGAIMQNGEWGGTPYRQPGLDTVAEFRSETNNSSAKMDRPGSFIITTKSGTNALHGSLVRDRPQQRYRRGTLADRLLCQAAAPGTQRVRCFRGWASHPAQVVQRDE